MMPPGRAGRALAVFWIVLIAAAGLGAATLQWLGPPGEAPRPPAAAAAHAEAARPEPASASVPGSPRVPEPSRQSTPAPPAPLRPGQPIPGPVAALLEAGNLPRIGADGRAPMRAYAGGVDPADTRPRIAILFGGIGLSASDSEEALRALPPAVTFVVSPYAAKPDRLLGEIRAHGHEFLLALPMEPQGYPLDDPGNQALLIGAPPTQNTRRLDWSLSRFSGYAGVTNAADGLRGERFAASSTMAPILQTLARRGLFYIDTGASRPADAPAALVARGIDLVLDEPAVRSEIDTRLARLEQFARDHGAAIGLASLPRPVTIDRIAAWTATLSERGIALVPASAIAIPVP